MSRVFILEFAQPDALLAAARSLREKRYELLDAYSPFPVEGVAELLDSASAPLRVHMFLGGMAFAATAYGLEVWSAVFDYPINSGGRPLNSWPAFMLFPFAIGIFGAALTGFVSLLTQAGLPRLHHSLFELDGFERATQDRFLLAVKEPVDQEDASLSGQFLAQTGAEKIRGMET